MKENGKKCWRQLFFTRNTLSQNPRQALKGQQWETKETSQREKIWSKRNCTKKRKHPRRDSNTSCARSQLPEVTLLRNGWLGKIVNFKAVFFAIRIVWSLWSCIYHEWEQMALMIISESCCIISVLIRSMYEAGLKPSSLWCGPSVTSIGGERTNSLWAFLSVIRIQRCRFQGKARFWR